MNQPPAHRPARWEDLAGCLAWPLLLKLPAFALRPAKLLIAFIFAIPLMLIFRNPPALYQPFAEVAESLNNYLTVFGAPNAANSMYWDHATQESLDKLTSDLQALTSTQIISGILIAGAALIILGIAAASLARSTALEVARGLEVSPRYMIAWPIRRWPATLLWLWPAILLPLLAIVPAIPLLIAVNFFPLGPIATLLIALGAFLAFIWLLIALVALAAAPLAPAAAACDDGDDFDALQRTTAITINKPIRLLLCYAMVAATTWLLATIAVTLASAVGWGLSLTSPRITPHIEQAMFPLQTLTLAITISTISTGLTLAYLYLRRIADEQDATEVPINA